MCRIFNRKLDLLALASSKKPKDAGHTSGSIGDETMKYLLRPYKSIACVPAALLLFGAGVFLAPPGTSAQSTRIVQALEQVDPALSHSSQGYLGVLVSDVDSDAASRLKLKEVRGALITLIDQDAPAG